MATISNTADPQLISGTVMVPVTSRAIKMGKVRERMVLACSNQVAESAVQKATGLFPLRRFVHPKNN